jgi:FkbM family methyltransferase
MVNLHSLRRQARKLGLDVSRFPDSDADYRAFRAFTSADPDVILDVGANDGGFARKARSFGYKGDVISFEPGRAALRRLSQAAQSDPRWFVEGLALGSEDAELTLNVAANDGASSSFLKMLATHSRAAPGADYVAQEKVPVRRLDQWYAAHGKHWARPSIKLDTQGFEEHVLAGAVGILPDVVAIQIELSLVPLYEGAWTWTAAVEWLDSHEFQMSGVTPGFSDPVTGRLLQFDAVFLAPY